MFYGKYKSHLFSFLLTICWCERLFEIKEKNTSCNQCLLIVTNEVSAYNMNDRFRMFPKANASFDFTFKI